MRKATPASSADHGPATPNPKDSMIRPVTIGPMKPPRLSALPLNATNVPRAVSDRPVMIVWSPGMPNHVPNAHTANVARASGSATTVSGSKKAAVANTASPERTIRLGPTRSMTRPLVRAAMTPTSPTTM